MLNDNSIFSAKFTKNNKECCTYNFEKLLNSLGLGTHMGVGINVDENGLQTFTLE